MIIYFENYNRLPNKMENTLRHASTLTHSIIKEKAMTITDEHETHDLEAMITSVNIHKTNDDLEDKKQTNIDKH